MIENFNAVYIPNSTQTTTHKGSGADAGLAKSKTYDDRFSVNYSHRSGIKRCHLSRAGLCLSQIPTSK